MTGLSCSETYCVRRGLKFSTGFQSQILSGKVEMKLNVFLKFANHNSVTFHLSCIWLGDLNYLSSVNKALKRPLSCTKPHDQF